MPCLQEVDHDHQQVPGKQGGVGPVTDLITATVTAVTTNCGTGAVSDEVDQYEALGSGLQNLGGGNYQFNWKTAKSDAGTGKTMHLDLGEGSTRTALFQFD